MRVPLLTVVVVLVVAVFLFWRRNPPANSPVPPLDAVEQRTAPTIPPPGDAPLVESPTASVPGHQPPRTSIAADALPASASGAPQPPGPAPAIPPPAAPSEAEVNPERIATDLDELSLSLRDYRTLAAQNPVGTNLEITEALMGKNRTGARLAPQDARVNAKGEMVDRWGTAYFFHQVSATSMEIHSAGPDKRLGTDDDIIHR